MTDYKTGRIYKIIHTQSNICYVGSTFDTLRNRWQNHKKDFKKYLNGKNNELSIYQYFTDFRIDNFKIILIKEYEVSDRKQLEAYEQLFINKLKPVNKYMPFRIAYLSNKKYQQDNKQAIAEKSKQYRQNNKDKIADYKKQYREDNKEKLLLNAKQYNVKQKINKNNYCLFCDKNYGKHYKEHLKTKSHLKKETLYYFNQLPTL